MIFMTNFESLKYTILQTCKNYEKQSDNYVVYVEPYTIKKIIVESDVDILHILIRESGYCDNFFVNTISGFYKTKNAIHDIDKNLISNYEYVIDTRINCLRFNDLFFSFGMHCLNYIDIKIMYEIELCVICKNKMFALGQKYTF